MTNKNNNSSSYENNKEKFYSKKNSNSKRDPYSVLNQSRNASTVDIQRAYKRGSRALHPDKQQASLGVQRNRGESNNAIVLSDIDAREAFVILKDSCEFYLNLHHMYELLRMLPSTLINKIYYYRQPCLYFILFFILFNLR
jgi:hypothetical protein